MIYTSIFGDKFSLTYIAIDNSWDQLAHLLIISRANINTSIARTNIETRVAWLETPLCLAVERGKIELIRDLLQHGARINCKDSHGNTPLHIVSYWDYPDKHTALIIAQLLLQNGANVNVRDVEGKTPLHFAVQGKGAGITEILIQHGAQINAIDEQGQSPLFYAIKMAARPSKIVPYLLHNGASTKIIDHNGDSVIYYAARLCEMDNRNMIESPVNQEMLKLLIPPGTYVNSHDKLGRTPLHFSVMGSPSDVTYLLHIGADINAVDAQGNTPLHLACEGCHTYSADVLVKAGANLLIKNKSGLTPRSVAEYQHRMHPNGNWGEILKIVRR
jgi:ankyrin repeat protein